MPRRLTAAAYITPTAVLPSGKVLLAGGGRGGLTSELFDFADNRWRSAGLLNVSRGSGHPQASTSETVVLSAYRATFKADRAVCGNDCGKALVAGNNDDRTVELYTPEPRIDGLDTTSGPTAGGSTYAATARGKSAIMTPADWTISIGPFGVGSQ